MRIVLNNFLDMKRFISFLCVLVFSLFLNVSNCLADETSSEINNDFSNQKKTNNIKDNIQNKNDIPKASNEDLFGDEQTFPFVAGLGKNAAH